MARNFCAWIYDPTMSSFCPKPCQYWSLLNKTSIARRYVLAEVRWAPNPFVYAGKGFSAEKAALTNKIDIIETLVLQFCSFVKCGWPLDWIFDQEVFQKPWSTYGIANFGACALSWRQLSTYLMLHYLFTTKSQILLPDWHTIPYKVRIPRKKYFFQVRPGPQDLSKTWTIPPKIASGQRQSQTPEPLNSTNRNRQGNIPGSIHLYNIQIARLTLFCGCYGQDWGSKLQEQ